ncbi:hypothetical protein [Kitasatospora sp. NPDC090091]|uniref:hypothetical protein n=1 Tax=Kitasatospora sp. NPDC090091 TaxID=3364081 RepID=UPI003824CA9D
MFEVKVSAVTGFADRVVGEGAGAEPAAVSVPPTLCADAGEDVEGARDIGDDVREAQDVSDVQSDISSDVDNLTDIGDNILDAIANFAEEATLVGAAFEAGVAGAGGGPGADVFRESASVGELLRVRRAALANGSRRS